jgi:hypothetical protein
MTARRHKPLHVRVRVLSKRTSEFDGPGVLYAIRTLGIKYQRAPRGGAWLVPGQHTDDLCAILESRGYRIEPTL